MRSIKLEYKKWQKWIEIIHKEIQQQFKYHHSYQKFINKELDVETLKFVDNCYFIQTAMAIRRQICDQKDAISLLKLLQQLEKASLTPDFSPFLPKDIRNDIKEISRIQNTIGLYIDRNIAHLDRREFHQNCRLKDLEDSLKILNRLISKYYKLFEIKI